MFDTRDGADVRRCAGKFGRPPTMGCVRLTEPGLGKKVGPRATAPRCVADFSALCPRRAKPCREGTVFRRADFRRGGYYPRSCLGTSRHAQLQPGAESRYRQSVTSAPRAGVPAPTGGDFKKGMEWRTVKIIKGSTVPLVIKGSPPREDGAEIPRSINGVELGFYV